MRKYTDEELARAVGSSSSLSACCRKLGGGHRYMKRRCLMLGLDISHWPKARLPKGGRDYRALIRKEIEAGRRTWACECCYIVVWYQRPIKFEIHHKDGDRLNNDLENLEILCPNCHSQTDTYKWRNKKS